MHELKARGEIMPDDISIDLDAESVSISFTEHMNAKKSIFGNNSWPSSPPVWQLSKISWPGTAGSN